MKRKLLIIGIIIAGAAAFAWHYSSNPWRASRVGEIPTPVGFKREEANDYTGFLRSLPMKKHGSKVRLYTGGKARLQFLSLGVIDLPLLSNSEQCADVTMRIRAEYLWKSGQYARIDFKDVNGQRHPYKGGSSRDAFERYLKATYDRSNTESVYKEPRQRSFGEVQPGDIFVYPSRRKGAYGHAVLVADVAKNRSGRTAVLCLEGNTPAREAHVGPGQRGLC